MTYFSSSRFTSDHEEKSENAHHYRYQYRQTVHICEKNNKENGISVDWTIDPHV